MHWVIFAISALIIIISGIELTKSADILSDKINLGKTWVGIILLGMVTSMPEAITSLASIIQINADDLAIANLLGSNNFNPILLVVMDFAYRKGAITNDIHYKKIHKFSAFFAIILTLVVILEMIMSKNGVVLKVGSFSLGTLFLCIFYLGFMRYLSVIEAKEQEPSTGGTERAQGSPLGLILTRLCISTICVIAAAMFLANSADTIALKSGLGRTFVGSIFLAFVTSLPEMVVTLSALRLGQLDLALGNIFGSNMTNIFIVFLCESFHKGGPILSMVSPTHIFTASLSIILILIIIWGLKTKNKKSYFQIGVDSLFMLMLFLLGTGLLYKFR